MKDKYDGWCVKAIHGLLIWTFEQRRSDVIKHWGENWEKARRSGEYKIVKVKLVEITGICQKPDRDSPKLICGHPLPCPHHRED